MQAANKTTTYYSNLPESIRSRFITAIMRGKDTGDDEKGMTEYYSKMRRENITTPVIYVGAGTCGLGAGAAKTISAVKGYLKDKAIEAEIIEVGCIGFCAVEPLMEVQLPGKTRVMFKEITEDKVVGALDDVFAGTLKNETIIGQHRNDKLEQWKGIPFVDEHPFFVKQTRWVLANCGIINPGSIDEYLAYGGYDAFLKAIHL